MEDSFEDFIRIYRNTKKEEPIEIKKEVLITAQVKKECEAKALQVVHFAIEGKIRPEALFKCLPFIDQTQYQDIVDERAIMKLCGYALCGKRIPEMPKKQYFISNRSNKVYDITDRKNYCSNYCYKASLHIKKQIDDSPLWLRRYDKLPNYTLLQKSDKGLPGELIDQGITRPVIEPSFTSISDFAKLSLDEAEEIELNSQEEKTKTEYRKPRKYQKKSMKTIDENEEEEGEIVNKEDKNEEEIRITMKETVKDEENKNINKINVTATVIPEEKQNEGVKEIKTATEIVTKQNKEKCDPKTRTSKFKSSRTNQEQSVNVNKSAKNPSDVDVKHQIQKCFKEWISLGTYIFIYGEEAIKEKLNYNKVSDYFEKLKISEASIEHQKKYLEICQKLRLRELAEEKFDRSVLGNNVLKPFPDYQQLKEDSRLMDLKVKAFYGGLMEIEEDSTSIKEKTDTETEEGSSTVLPLITTSSQNFLRRKIFLASLNKLMQTLLRNLRLSPTQVIPDIQALVKTFKFKADNITFTPGVFNFIAIILLKILSLKDGNVKERLDEPKSRELLNLWLAPLPEHEQFINDILKLLQNVDDFVEEYITQEK